jgi:hypothetical protein
VGLKDWAEAVPCTSPERIPRQSTQTKFKENFIDSAITFAAVLGGGHANTACFGSICDIFDFT